MTKRTSVLALTALLTGVVALTMMPADFFESLFQKKQKNTPARFFKINDVIGRADRTSPLPLVTLSKSTLLENGNLLITHADSKILLSVESQGDVWVMPFSKVELLQDKGEPAELHLIYGEIKKSQGTTIETYYRGALIQNDEFSTVTEALISPLPFSNEVTFKEISLKESAPQNKIEKQIFESLLLHKRFFQGCLVKHYKKENGQISGGETVFDLLISTNGVIEKTTVMRSQINSKEYLNCLEQVLQRVRFKGLTLKEPLHAVFPLNIEL